MSTVYDFTNKHISLKHISVTVMTSNYYRKGSQLNAMLSFTNNDFCLDAFRSETWLPKKDINFCFGTHKISIACSEQSCVTADVS